MILYNILVIEISLRNDAKDIFSAIDNDGSGSIEFPEFVSMFRNPLEAADISNYGVVSLTPDGSNMLRPTNDEIESAAKDSKEIKAVILDALTKQQNASKIVQNHSRFLTCAFRQFDMNGDGVLTYGELQEALVSI